jgi:hypothetical protein
MHQRFWSEIPGGKEYVAVGAVHLPPSFTAHYAEDDAGAPDVAITFEVRDGVPQCREVRITATDGGHEVRHSGIVGVRIEDALDQAIKNLLLGDRDKPGAVRTAVRESEAARSSRRVVITEALLGEVSEVYRSHIGHKPTQAVADHFGKSHRTAALYVDRARKAGLLPETGQGKAKA